MFAGVYGAVFFFVATVGGGIGARLLKICLSDVWIAVIAGVLSFMGSIYTAFAKTTLMMFFGNIFQVEYSSNFWNNTGSREKRKFLLSFSKLI